MNDITKKVYQPEAIGFRNLPPKVNWAEEAWTPNFAFVLWFDRYKPAENVILLDKEKNTLFLDQKKKEIELKDISQIVLKFRSDDIRKPEPHGKIIFRTKDGKKHKQRHVENIFGVAERIVEEMVKLGFDPPNIIDKTIITIYIETDEQKQNYRNHMKTAVWK